MGCNYSVKEHCLNSDRQWLRDLITRELAAKIISRKKVWGEKSFQTGLHICQSTIRDTGKLLCTPVRSWMDLCSRLCPSDTRASARIPRIRARGTGQAEGTAQCYSPGAYVLPSVGAAERKAVLHACSSGCQASGAWDMAWWGLCTVSAGMAGRGSGAGSFLSSPLCRLSLLPFQLGLLYPCVVPN